MQSVMIKGDSDSEILSIKLTDVLQRINNGKLFNWAILWIKATGDLDTDGSIISFEREVNESTEGLKIHWNDLNLLAAKFEQVIELLLIGSQNPKDITRYQDDKTMYLTCDYTIELIDSSYWLIHCRNENNLSELKETLPGSEYHFEAS